MVNFPERIKALYKLMSPCRLCPHECVADRSAGKKGKCRSGAEAVISSHNLHFGEEPPISGFRGSGTIFFTNCSLSCVFCQNYPISQLNNGRTVTVKELAAIMLELQEQRAHNINFVTPTHFLPLIVDAVHLAKQKGLSIPLVYNSSGFEGLEALKLLDGVIDIYLPDAKYCDRNKSAKYSGAAGYWEANKLALREMHRQVGNLTLDKDGVAVKGLLVRHLVLPNDISGSKDVLEFIAGELSPETYVSVMAQYHPANKSEQYPELSRKVSAKEYGKVVKLAENLGLTSGWIQEL
jgi:putative pyruvate formate lyase activating enzyme